MDVFSKLPSSRQVAGTEEFFGNIATEWPDAVLGIKDSTTTDPWSWREYDAKKHSITPARGPMIAVTGVKKGGVIQIEEDSNACHGQPHPVQFH